MRSKMGLSSPTGRSTLGASVGLVLELDPTKGAYFVKDIAPLSPAALCGNLAIGDCLTSVNGKRIEGGGSGREELLKAVLDSDDQMPVWLGVERGLGQIGSAGHYVCVRKQKPLDDEGFMHEQHHQVGLGVRCWEHERGIKIVDVQRGFAAWLSQQCPPDGLKGCLLEGDVIFAVDGQSVCGKPLAESGKRLIGPTWSRVQVSVMRHISARPA
eukprot:CAMPEP_0206247352 /NCGR_PEP_ID=MMETSP0047_2-20121206/19763_1 /ASSEMBLY_ACC=CAM_ASM_000192 /TAXON_ID=195065 /ORGANISM="Chroomonas mesostigmatica_cf, Strain CCMP1168" /LENGTH=212 /DNA_ID=CAMNT_0053672869 /DNA_START=112 /DNA_END=747 /DNA_ORIENTATION=+